MIDENKLMEEVRQWKRKVDKDCGEMPNVSYLTGYISALSVVEGMIAQQPTIDAVEVVRCKDCRSCGVYKSGNLYCTHQNAITNPKPNDFCCHGERRSDETG